MRAIRSTLGFYFSAAYAPYFTFSTLRIPIIFFFLGPYFSHRQTVHVWHTFDPSCPEEKKNKLFQSNFLVQIYSDRISFSPFSEFGVRLLCRLGYWFVYYFNTKVSARRPLDPNGRRHSSNAYTYFVPITCLQNKLYNIFYEYCLRIMKNNCTTSIGIYTRVFIHLTQNVFYYCIIINYYQYNDVKKNNVTGKKRYTRAKSKNKLSYKKHVRETRVLSNKKKKKMFGRLNGNVYNEQTFRWWKFKGNLQKRVRNVWTQVYFLFAFEILF